MKIEKISIDDIVPYENNAKIHTEEHIQQIKTSIELFGNNDPIAIDENNKIIEGHGRYFALKELGYDTVEVIRLSHLDEEKKRAYILAHNKLTMNTGFDFKLLQDELDCLNIDMSQFGFDVENISYIDYLEENGFSSLSNEVANGCDTFSISFQFPVEKKSEIESFIKEKSKEYFVAYILKEMEK